MPGLRARLVVANDVLTAASGRRIGDAAAESAFFSAVAVLPLLLTTATVLRAVKPVLGRDAEPGVTRGLSGVLRVVLTSRGSSAADAADRLLTGTATGLLTVGTVASVVLLTRAMRSLLTGLGEIHHGLGAARRPAGLRSWAHAVGLALLGVLLVSALTAIVALGPLFGYSARFGSDIASPVKIVWRVVRFPVAALGVFGFVLLVHRVGAGPRPERVSIRRWRLTASAGAATTTVAAAAVSLLLPLYVRVGRSVSPTLGVLGGGLILLIWVFLLAYALLLGAQLRVRLLHGTDAHAS